MGDDWEVIQRRWLANLVAFVSSPLADYINGANLRIDGGKSPSVN